VFVTGNSTGSLDAGTPGSGTGLDYATVAYDAATGARRWVARYNGPGSLTAFARALGVSSDGATIAVTGLISDVGAQTDYGTVFYDTATGQRLGVATLTAGGASEATALAMSPLGTAVFVTGSAGGLLSDFGTVAYRLPG